MLVNAVAVADEYRTPGSVTPDERRLMMAANSDYQHCLRDEVGKVSEEVTDPRVIADSAMQACTGVLDEMDTNLEQRGFAPDFRKRFRNTTMQRASRELLQMAMFIAAQRTSR